jgi:deazaflavin-dependent oxidoreductase (nitroreductase family)
MAKIYQVNFAVRLSNAIVTFLIRLGVPVGPMALLTVPGRKSGELRTTPIAIDEVDGQRWLIAPFGHVNWVRNLRAAGGGTITRRGRTERIVAIELSSKDAAPVLKSAITRGPSFIKSYFDVTPESSVEEFEREASRHPVFRLDRVASPTEMSAQSQQV